MQKNIILFLVEIMRKKTEVITVQDTMPLLSLLTIATCKEAALGLRKQYPMVTTAQRQLKATKSTRKDNFSGPQATLKCLVSSGA